MENRGSLSGRSARAARSRAPAVRTSGLRGARCDPRARRLRRHSLHRRGDGVFALWFRVVFAGGGSADYNDHELAPLLVTSESGSRLWFYDFSTDLLAGIYPDWLADIDPGYRRYGGAVAQIRVWNAASNRRPLADHDPVPSTRDTSGSWRLRRHGADDITAKLGTVLFFVPLCSTWDRLNGNCSRLRTGPTSS